MSTTTTSTARLRAAASVAVLCLLVLLIGSARADAASREFFGVMPQDPLTTEDFTTMGDARVGTLRFEIAWDHTDPTAAPNDYQFGQIDALVGNLARQGIRPLPFIFGAPKWVVEIDGQNCPGSECRIQAPRHQAGLAAFQTFMADLVRRYGPNGTFWALNPTIPKKPITTWQIWNEQNSDSFYGPKPNVRSYAKLLDAAHDGIGSVDPEADVLLGGMFGTPRQGRKPSIFAWKYLDKLYAVRGAKKDFDGVGIHPYAGQMTKVIQQTELMIESIENARDRKATTWITELGWASSGPPNPLVKGKKGQAQRLKESFKYFLKNRRKFNTQTVIWYSWRDNNDSEGLCEWCAGSGLLKDNGAGKPAFDAFTGFTGGN